MFEELIRDGKIRLRIRRHHVAILGTLAGSLGKICREHQLVSVKVDPIHDQNRRAADAVELMVELIFRKRPAMRAGRTEFGTYRLTAEELYGCTDIDNLLRALESYELMPEELPADEPLIALAPTHDDEIPF